MYAIVAISAGGVGLAARLYAALPGSVVYTLPELVAPGMQPISGSLGMFTGELFDTYKKIIFIMATGIVVRCIAPYIRHKATDPAVVAIDETGRFAISLLSGHLGGANELATTIAEAIGATPVITTASDIKGLISVDMLAKQHGLIIHNLNEAKQITAMMVNGHKVAVINETIYDMPLPDNTSAENAEGIILVTHKASAILNKPFVRLLAPNIIIGIGCRRGTEGKKIFALITQKLTEGNIDQRCIRCIASADLKADEPGIHEASRMLGVKPVFISREEIQGVERFFTPSGFVKETTGVSAVCEPAAYIAGGCNGRFLLDKQSEDGMTLAFFEERMGGEV